MDFIEVASACEPKEAEVCLNPHQGAIGRVSGCRSTLVSDSSCHGCPKERVEN
jgi:hypothetical protein